MLITDDDKPNIARHSLELIRDNVSKLLDKAVQDQTNLNLHGGIFWTLTARRIQFDYTRINRPIAGYRRTLINGLSANHFTPAEAHDVVTMLDSLERTSGALLEGARRRLTDGNTFTIPDDDPQAIDIIESLLTQEIHGDEPVISRLRDVTSDPFPALYSREEFLELEGFYAGQSEVIAALAAAHNQFSGRMTTETRERQQALLAKLKRNLRRINDMLDNALLMDA